MNKHYFEIENLIELYSKGENIIKYLRHKSNVDFNSLDSIKISYDLQSGSYIDFYKNNKEHKERYFKCIGDVLNKLGSIESVLEVGVGEATTLVNLLKHLTLKPKSIFGFDLSWSRIKFANDYCNNAGLSNIQLATGDLFYPPYLKNSFDLVYTSHTLEPNGGREKEAISALYNITKRYLVLFEPFYEFASKSVKERMHKNGYVTGLKKTVEDLGYKIVDYKLLKYSSEGLVPEKSQNPTGVIIIEKEYDNSNNLKPDYACPYTKNALQMKDNYYTIKSGLLSYPIIENIPCLNPDNAILTTHQKTNIDEFLK